MLYEVLKTISTSKQIDKTIIVSHDQSVFDIGKRFSVIEVFDERESGVNDAVKLADEYISNSDFDTSVIFPQDIPFFDTSDIENLFSFFRKSRSIIFVPSRHFNGTNSLVRNPASVMRTRYDEGTYKSQLREAKSNNIDFSLVLIQRLMLDIDTRDDIKFAMKHNEKSELCQKMMNLLD